MAAILGKAWEAYNFMFDELPGKSSLNIYVI